MAKLLLLLPLATALLFTVDADDELMILKRDANVSLGALQTIVEQQASVIQSLQADLSIHKNRLDSMQRKVDAASKAVVFGAGTVNVETDVSSMSFGEAIVFDGMHINIGVGYNHNTGFFTAPVSGTYIFFLNVMSTPDNPRVILNILKGNIVLGTVMANGPQGYSHQGTGHVAARLNAGEKVHVRPGSGYQFKRGWYTYFSGFLLNAD